MHENTEVQKKKRNLEIVKWIAVAILLNMAIFFSYFYRNVQILFSSFITVALTTIAIYISSLTKKGKEIIIFFREARIEARKIIWPSWQETLYTSLIVVVVTSIMSFVLWGLDGILIYLVSFITNLRF